ncbi:glycosyltransferase family 2 protein [Candidatus Gracilibacteria bacterium]|nr:glycosyltransferase family 2 protein [Candidatus Gracilibacteria bacterium]
MKLSIIIPTIGRETLLAVLDGIGACEEFEAIKPEILVVFDGKENEVIVKKIQNDKNIKILETGEKVFASGARNLGIEKATGDIIVFIGDDTVPKKDWLKKIYDFHIKFPEKERGLLGKISWTKSLAKDSFHKFLETGPQFNFPQIKKHGATWRHFYTSNISVKKSLFGEVPMKFSTEFKGWGFEDIEFGYRLNKRGLVLSFDESCEVLHDHPQNFKDLIRQTIQARENAKIFEKLHPEIKILPQGGKFVLLRFLIFLSWFFVPYSKKLFWWREWKKAWIGF